MQKKYRALSNEVRNQNERLNAQDNINLDVDQQLNEIEKQCAKIEKNIKHNINEYDFSVLRYDNMFAPIMLPSESEP